MRPRERFDERARGILTSGGVKARSRPKEGRCPGAHRRDGAAVLASLSSSRRCSRGGAAASVRSLGTDCLFVSADVSIAADCYRLVDTALEHFGSVNGLVNSAAISDRGTLLDTSLELWDRHFNTNVRGPFLMMQGVVRHLVETGKPGSMVNILSMVAH